MGCYDMVVGNFVCPYCDNVERIVLEQTKAGECNFTDYGLGECAPGFYNDYVDKGNRKCGTCKKDYDYSVKYESGFMTSIKITDTMFNKVYTYHKAEECVSKNCTEEELKNMSSQLKWLREILDFNDKRKEQAEKIIQDVIPKIDILKSKITKQLNHKYGIT